MHLNGTALTVESWFAACIAGIGILSNLLLLLTFCFLKNLRRPMNAFLLHQCLLDGIRSAYCIPFSVVNVYRPTICSALAGTYIVLVTCASFNLLAIVMNEAYSFSDITLGVNASQNCCCVWFALVVIWFTAIITNLGVAFMPGGRSIEQCRFTMGVTNNYVLHVVWLLLETMAILMTVAFLCQLAKDISKCNYYRLSTLVRATVSIDPSIRTNSQRRQSVMVDKRNVRDTVKMMTYKLRVLSAYTALFVVACLPLLTLYAIEPLVDAPRLVYKFLSILAWSQPLITPFAVYSLIKGAGGFFADPSDYSGPLLLGQRPSSDGGLPQVRIETSSSQYLSAELQSGSRYDFFPSISAAASSTSSRGRRASAFIV